MRKIFVYVILTTVVSLVCLSDTDLVLHVSPLIQSVHGTLWLIASRLCNLL